MDDQLMHGARDWNRLVSQAHALQQQSAHGADPLAGRDLLTFIGKIRPDLSEDTCPPAAFASVLGIQEHRNTALSQFLGLSHQPADTNARRQHRGIKRTVDSPYFIEPSEESPQQPFEVKDGHRSRKKKKKKKSRRARDSIEEPPEPPQHVPVINHVSAVPELHSAASWEREEGKEEGREGPAEIRGQHSHFDFKSQPLVDGQGSTSGKDVLQDEESRNESIDRDLYSKPSFSQDPELRGTETAAPQAQPNSPLQAFPGTPIRKTPSHPVQHGEQHASTNPPLSAREQQKQVTRTPRRGKQSHYFETPTISPSKASRTPRPTRGIVSALPFPRLDAPHFGLVQEELAKDPFQLLVAVTFLIRTHGKQAIPVFRRVIARWPTPQDLAEADTTELIHMIRHLGLGAVRAATLQRYARSWLAQPPTPDTRYGVKNYPVEGDGKGLVSAGERLSVAQTREVCGCGYNSKGGDDCGCPNKQRGQCDSEDLDAETGLTAEDPRLSSAWEIGHLTQGPYALDSWRIFCRDELLGLSDDWRGHGYGGEQDRDPRVADICARGRRRKSRDARKGEAQGSTTTTFQPEWMRVLPQDKELRACLRWMWMREGWDWDPITGDREVLSARLRDAVQERRVAWDNTGQLQILDKAVEDGGAA